jgi:phasin family protein
MFPYSRSVIPAVRTHLDAQTAFLNDVSKSIFHSFQQLQNLNLQLVQTLLEETTLTSKQLLTADQHTDVIDAAASRAQPAVDKLRAYQQHLSRLAADSQVELARVAEEHIQQTSQTAKALAEEVARTAVEDTERHIQKQEQSIHQFSDPFMKGAAKRGSNSTTVRGTSSMQSSASGNTQGGSPGSSQGSGKPS